MILVGAVALRDGCSPQVPWIRALDRIFDHLTQAVESLEQMVQCCGLELE